jgi:hypothetical protein
MQKLAGTCEPGILGETGVVTPQSTRHFISLLAAIPPALFVVSSAAQAGDESIAKALGEGMAGFVAGLDDDQRDEAHYAFDDAERFDLRLAPIGLEGLKISEMAMPNGSSSKACSPACSARPASRR